ncbi:MAG: phage baseplate protein [Cetobacterium sp.]|uniref:phage baseplate protein n=1 Tax=Cetobacterium sp. TaxID=2071632 RepID=UPI003EE72934
MKQDIGIGSVVDDGTGDYLRRGGEKINSNFNELYDNLGDGQVPHPAGAWKTHEGAPLSPKFGQSYNVNTTAAPVTVTLPEGRVGDYGKVVKLRDVWGTWGTNPVTLIPSGTNTIKGGSSSKKLNRNHQDIELVLVSPGSWEYLENKMVNRLSASNLNTVAKKEIIATKGQIDFVDIFGEAPYNADNIEVYRRGNLLYYGPSLTTDSDFGSIGTGSEIVPLDGKTIRLRVPCDEGDVVTIITYMDDVAVYRSSYVSKTVTVWNKSTGKIGELGQTIVVDDLTKKDVWSLVELGFLEIDGQLNPNSVEVLINGQTLTQAGTGGLPAFACEHPSTGADMPEKDEHSCIAAGGLWKESGVDFSVLKNEVTSRLDAIRIREPLENGDQLSVRWFNNDIGTVMDWEDIKEHTDDVYLNNEYRFNRSKKLRYNDYDNPNPCTSEVEDEVENNIKFTTIVSLLESIYPVGTVYMNAHNKENPSLYMGFGRWVPYAKGKAIVGWDSGTDANFSYYNGACGTLQSPGGTGGTVQHELTIDQVPQLKSEDKVLIKDDNGDVLIGQCLLDPDDDGPGYRKYREDILNTNAHAATTTVSMLQPYVTVAAWLRVE